MAEHKNRRNKYFPLSIKFIAFFLAMLFLIFSAISIIWLHQERESINQQLVLYGSISAMRFAASIKEKYETDSLNAYTVAIAYTNDPNIKSAYMVNSVNNIYLIHVNQSNEYKPVILPKIIHAGSNYALVRYPETGRTYMQFTNSFWVYDELEGYDIKAKAYIEIPAERAKQLLFERFSALGIVFLAAALLSAIGTAVLVRLLITPISKLAASAKIIGGGNLKHRIHIKSNDELGLLANEFNEMTRRLELAEKERIKQEVLKRELSIAQEIQKGLLPKAPPQTDSLDIAFAQLMAREVGGDYFDFITAPNGLGVIIGDVTGKSIPAAMVMTLTRSAMRSLAAERMSAREILARLNNVLYYDTKPGIFMTAFYCAINESEKLFEYASAGHDPVIYFDGATRKFAELKTEGFPLGLDNPENFLKQLTVSKMKIKSGDTVILYTDGLTDMQNSRHKIFGIERAYETLSKNIEKPAETIVQSLLSELNAFRGKKAQYDDTTIIVIKIK